MIGYGAEKDPRLHRADTGTPVRRRLRAERRGSPAALGIFQREYPIINYAIQYVFPREQFYIIKNQNSLIITAQSAGLFHINLADVGVQADFAGAFAVGIVASFVGAAVYADFSDIC